MPIENVHELNKLFLFELLNREELPEVADMFIEKIYPSGGKIFTENEKGETMYVIRTGSVKITKLEKGVERVVATLVPGDFFGEIALFDYTSRTATAFANEGTALLSIKRHGFNDFFNRKPALAAKILYQMMTEMSRRLRKHTFADQDIVF